MTDRPPRTTPLTRQKLRQHEVNIEPPSHPGEPRRLVSSEHEVTWRGPLPSPRPLRARRERIG